jgi:integrase
MARGTIVTRTTKEGVKRYYTALWIETPDGCRKQIWRTFDKKTEAEDFLDNESKKAREGEYIEPSPMKFKEFAAEWIGKYPKLARRPMKPSTFAGYCSLIDKHLNPFFGAMSLGKIRPVAIDKDFRAQLPEDLAENTKRNILMLLRTMLQSAAEWDLLPGNPFTARRKVHVPASPREKKGRALTPEEITKLLNTCEGETKTIVAATLLTGMRRAEVFGLRESDIDLEKNLIQVQQTIFWKQGKTWNPEEHGPVFVAPKSKASIRKIDLSPALRKMLLEHRLRKGNAEGLVFANPDGSPRDPRSFAKYEFRPAVKIAGLGKVRFHDLRHTFGSLKIAQGEDLLYVSRQMGHSSINITVDIYGHLIRETNPEAAARTDSLIFGKNSAAC